MEIICPETFKGFGGELRSLCKQCDILLIGNHLHFGGQSMKCSHSAHVGPSSLEPGLCLPMLWRAPDSQSSAGGGFCEVPGGSDSADSIWGFLTAFGGLLSLLPDRTLTLSHWGWMKVIINSCVHMEEIRVTVQRAMPGRKLGALKWQWLLTLRCGEEPRCPWSPEVYEWSVYFT